MIYYSKLAAVALATGLLIRAIIPPNPLQPKKDDKVTDGHASPAYFRLWIPYSMTTVLTQAVYYVTIYGQRTFLATASAWSRSYPFLATPLSWLAAGATMRGGISQPWTLWEMGFLALSIGGSLLRLWSFHTLGKFFTYVVNIRPEHKLVTSGPYRCLMHPSYSGILAGVIGFHAFGGLSSPFLWALVMFHHAYLLPKRIPDEERALRKHFGEDQWNRYASSRWRLIPFIY